MRRWPLLSGFLVAALAACGGGGEGSGQSLPADYRGSEVQPRTTDYVPPTAEPGPTGVAGNLLGPELAVRGRVRQLLLPQVRLSTPPAPTCAGSVRPDGRTRTVRCVVLFRELRVPFDVEISGLGRPYYRLAVDQLQGLLVTAAVRDAWATENRSATRPLSCEAGLPEAALVPLNAPTKYRCAVGPRLYAVQITMAGERSAITFEPVR